jgi:hypothetical protein
MKLNNSKINKNKKAGITTQVIAILIVVVFTSALILYLINSGIITPKEQNEVDVLNTRFLYQRESGELKVNFIKACELVSPDFECINERTDFKFNEQIHFLISVESPSHNGKINLVENYEVKNPTKQVVLSANPKDNFYFEKEVITQSDTILFKDFFVINDGESGEYVANFIIQNPMINKHVGVAKSINILN